MYSTEAANFVHNDELCSKAATILHSLKALPTVSSYVPDVQKIYFQSSLLTFCHRKQFQSKSM